MDATNRASFKKCQGTHADLKKTGDKFSITAISSHTLSPTPYAIYGTFLVFFCYGKAKVGDRGVGLIEDRDRIMGSNNVRPAKPHGTW